MRKFLTFPFIIRIGLVCVFLANSLIAFLSPAEFQELISDSFLADMLPMSAATFIIGIGINDFMVAMLLFSGWHTSRVAMWAALWLAGVIVVIGAFSLDTLEHLGFLAMAVALAMRTDTKQ